MISVNPAAVLWKHIGQPIVCREVNGQMTILPSEWPASAGNYPTQAEVDTWAAEYAARDQKEETYQGDMSDARNRLVKAILLCINDGSIVSGANATPTQLKTAIKAKL